MKYSINNGTVTVTSLRDDGFGYTTGRVYLETGKTYRFTCNTNGTWGDTSGTDTVEAFLALNGEHTYSALYRRMSSNNCTFTVEKTGLYFLRLDVNKSGESHTFSNLCVTEIVQESTKTYGTAYGTLPTPSGKVDFDFVGWATDSNLISSNMNVWEQGGIADATGQNSSNVDSIRLRLKDYLKVASNSNYTLTTTGDVKIRYVYLYDGSKIFISHDSGNVDNAAGRNTVTFTTPSNCQYIRVVLQNTDYTQEITLSELATANLTLTGAIDGNMLVPDNDVDVYAQWSEAVGVSLILNDPVLKDGTKARFVLLPANPVPEGYTYKEYGILYQKENTSEYNNTNAKSLLIQSGIKKISKLTTGESYNLNVTPVDDQRIWAMGYLIFEKDGKQTTIYTDVKNAKVSELLAQVTETLTYNANGHGTAPANVTMTYADATNAAAALTENGYIFTGWNTAADGTGTAYAAGAEVKAANTLPTEMTLYAQWSEASLILNDPVLKDGTKARFVLLPANPVPEGYTYKEYGILYQKENTSEYNNTNAKSLLIQSGIKKISKLTTGESYNLNVTPVDDQRIWAMGYLIFEKDGKQTTIYTDVKNAKVSELLAQVTETLTYNANGHGTAPANVTMTYADATNAAAALTENGYIFTGWNTAADGTGTAYAAGAEVKAANTLPTEMTLYAQWTPNTYTITLNNQSATTAGTTTIYEKYNDGYYLNNSSGTVSNKMSTSANGITVPTKSGYTFGGYYTATNGGGTQFIDANGKLTSSASATQFSAAGTLYAKWSKVYNIGDTVNYSTTLNGVTLDDWKVFYKETKNGVDYTYIILGDYLPNAAVSSTVRTTYKLANVDGIYSIKSTQKRGDVLNAMTTKSNWDELLTGTLNGTTQVNETRTANVWAMGAPTLELWVNSWNAKYPSDTLYTKYENRVSGQAFDGWYIGNTENPTTTYISLSSKTGYGNTLYYPHQAVEQSCKGYWLASPSAYDSFYVMNVKFDGYVTASNYFYSNNGFRPVVCLPSSVLE